MTIRLAARLPRLRKGHRRRRALVFTIVILIFCTIWTLASAALAWRALKAAEANLQSVRTALSAGDPARATAALAEAKQETRSAKWLLRGPIWASLAQLPYLGPSVRVTRSVVNVADDITHGPAQQIVLEGAALTPDALRGPDRSLNLRRLQEAARPLSAAQAAVGRERAVLAHLPRGHVLRAVAAGRARVESQLTTAERQLGTAAQAATLAPTMLGVDGPRRYFVGIQNLAELRGAGGNIGEFAVLVADQGRLRIERTGDSFDYVKQTRPVADMGKDFIGLYGTDPLLDIRDANVSPHFPYAGKLWAAHWHAQSGQHVDGAIGIDPVALSDLLGVTGPVDVPGGQQINADNIVDFALRDEYALRSDNRQRKDYLQAIARTVFERIASTSVTRALASALTEAVATRHLLLYSTHPSEQTILEATPAAGAIPGGASSTVIATLNNDAGTKLDYYLQESVSYRIACARGNTTGTLTMTLRNDAPTQGLPPYVIFRSDIPGGRSPIPGQTVSLLTVYLPGPASPFRMAVNGHEAGTAPGRELGYVAYRLPITLNPQSTTTVSFSFHQPPLPPMLRTQALAHAPVVKVVTAGCR